MMTVVNNMIDSTIRYCASLHILFFSFAFRFSWSTGTSILTGGMIMVITFGSLLLTDEPALQQIGFFLLCSSVFDFFVIRLVVIPGLIAHPFFASWAWWPRTFKHGQIDVTCL